MQYIEPGTRVEFIGIAIGKTGHGLGTYIKNNGLFHLVVFPEHTCSLLSPNHHWHMKDHEIRVHHLWKQE